MVVVLIYDIYCVQTIAWENLAGHNPVICVDLLGTAHWVAFLYPYTLS